MTNLELENWKIKRAHGVGRFLIRTAAWRCLIFSVPAGILLLLAHWLHGQDTALWENDGTLIWAFAAITVLIGVGDGLFGWLAREQEYARKTSFLEQRLATSETFSKDRHLNTMTPFVPDLPVNDSEETIVDTSLIQEARSIQTAHERGFANLDDRCAKFDPLFKLAMAKDTFLLATKASVCENAAFLALMSQFDN